MSSNTLPYNPALLQDVANAVQGYLPTTGITTIQTPDSNLVASVAGNIAQLSLASNITVANTVNTSNLTVSTFKNPFTSNQPATNGDVLSCTTTGVLSWITPSIDTGITVINTPDNNLVATVVGNTANISLASNISVSNTVSTSNLVVSTFTNPFTSNQPATNGDVLSCTTAGALSWITPSAPPTTTGLLQDFYLSTGQNTSQTGSPSANIWTNNFTNLDPTKKYRIRVNASWYVPTIGGVAGAGFVRFTRGMTPIQTFNLYFNQIDEHLSYSFVFNDYTPASANENWIVFVQSTTGNIQTDTGDYFCVEINEIQ
jgi:hypothetical protein